MSETKIKRTYRQGEGRGRVGQSIWLSEAEAQKLAAIAQASGLSKGELMRAGLVTVLARFESTGAIELSDGRVVEIQPDLFGGVMVKTTDGRVEQST